MLNDVEWCWMMLNDMMLNDAEWMMNDVEWYRMNDEWC